MNERVERLQKKMQEEGLGACVISDHSAVEYFIGRRFSCGERLIALIVTTEGLPKLVLNELFPLAPQTDFELVRYNDTEDGVQIVSRFLNGKVGIDKFWSAGFLLDGAASGFGNGGRQSRRPHPQRQGSCGTGQDASGVAE